MERITKKLFETHTLGPATREWLVSARRRPALNFAQMKYAGYSKDRSGYQFVRHSQARAFKRERGVPPSLFRSRSDSHRSADAIVRLQADSNPPTSLPCRIC